MSTEQEFDDLLLEPDSDTSDVEPDEAELAEIQPSTPIVQVGGNRIDPTVTIQVKTKAPATHQKPGARRFDASYLKYGFHWNENKSDPLPVCLTCTKVLSNETMVPSKLIIHLKSQHPQLVGKPLEYFQLLLSAHKQLQRSADVFKEGPSMHKNTTLASFQLSELLAIKRRPHSDGEKLLKPALEISTKALFGEEKAKLVKQIPLSARTVSDRIRDMANDIKLQLIERLKGKSFSYQCDETTDIEGKSQLIHFIKYKNGEQFEEDYLGCNELKTTTRGIDVYVAASALLERFELSWAKCQQICTDGAPSMVGAVKGFLSILRRKWQHIQVDHCFIHREALACKVLPFKLQEVLSLVIKIINSIKSKPKQSRLFADICKEFEEDFEKLVFYTDIRWLSRGNALRRFFELRESVLEYCKKYDFQDYVAFLSNATNIEIIAYLVDVFDQMNKLNLKLQGKGLNVLAATEHLKTFQDKIKLWYGMVKKNEIDMFANLNAMKKPLSLDPDLITGHLVILAKKLKHYYPKLDSQLHDWILNPFDCPLPSHLAYSAKEQLLEIRNSQTIRMKFEKCTIEEFWITIEKIYGDIGNQATNILQRFASTYLCEQGFSALCGVKSKLRVSLLHLDEELRVHLSKIRPRVEKLTNEMQSHVSH